MPERPFLKWAGNKFNCLDKIKPHLPSGQRLIEPFAGSAAMSLNCDYPQYLISDTNHDLIKLYQCLKKEGQAFIKSCAKHFHAETNDKDMYYFLRDKFNRLKVSRQKAILFLYLNRHAYNGLCRYNLSGEFNVPFGRYLNPKLPSSAMELFHQKSQHIEIIHADFATIMAQAKKGDVIYCDPPYVPLSGSAYFTAYTKSQFGPEQQQQLAKLAREKAAEGIPVIVSNHDTKFTRECYKGAKIHSFEVPRYISCKVAERKKAKELIAIFT